MKPITKQIKQINHQFHFNQTIRAKQKKASFFCFKSKQKNEAKESETKNYEAKPSKNKCFVMLQIETKKSKQKEEKHSKTK